jgi:hypothetical protein
MVQSLAEDSEWQHQELNLWQQESEAGSRRARLEEEEKG